MKKHRLGSGFYVDWSDLGVFLEEYTLKCKSIPNRSKTLIFIPRLNVTAAIVREYECDWDTALKKLVEEAESRRDWDLVKLPKGSWPRSRVRWFLRIPMPARVGPSMLRTTRRRR